MMTDVCNTIFSLNNKKHLEKYQIIDASHCIGLESNRCKKFQMTGQFRVSSST